MNVGSLLMKLIAINSVSGNEKALGTFLYSLLKPYFEVERIYIDKNRFNLLARTGVPQIYLSTHLDTVPLGNNILNEDKEKIYGRGACDAKGSMAAMIYAAIKLRKNGITNFGLFFNVGEETDFVGIRKGLPEKIPPFVVIGEPTELFPVIGQRGLLGFQVIAKGKSAHGATPELGDSAINKIVKAITLLNTFSMPEDKTLGKSSLNIGIIQGGNNINSVPDNARIEVEIRTVMENEYYIKLLENLLTGFTIAYRYSYNPIIIRDKGFISDIIKLTNKQCQIKKGFTELFFWPKGIILGPGNAVNAHSDNEFILKAQLKEAVKIYSTFILLFTKRKRISPHC